MKKRTGTGALLVLVLALATLAKAQETVNGGMVVLGPLRSNGSSAVVDFTGAATTAPVKSGTLAARPGTCGVGQMYFATDAAAGQNLSYCTPPGNWTGMSGGSSGPCKLASALGFALDGSDETALLNTTFANYYTAGGGCLAIDAGKTLRADDQITMPAASANSTQNGVGGKTPWIRITGAGGAFFAFGPSFLAGGSTLDLRYKSSGISAFQGGPKLIGVGAGVLELDHITVTTGAASDCATFLMTTVTAPFFHDLTISGTGCNGGVVLGGSSGITSPYPANSPLTTAVTGWFQGYGGMLDNIKLVGIGNATAPAILMQSQVNQFLVRHLWIGLGGSANAYMLNGGGSYSSSPGAAIDIEGHGPGTDANRSNVIEEGIIEMGGARGVPGIDYNCGVKLHYATQNTITAVGFYDGNGSTAAFCGDSTAVWNKIDKSNYVDTTGSTMLNSTWSANNYMPWRTIGFFFDGGGMPLSGTTTRCSLAGFAGAINQFTMAADQAGSATVTVKAVPLGSYTGPGSASDISNGGEFLSGASWKQDSTLAGWSYAGINPAAGPISSNTMVCFTLSNPSGITWLSGGIQLWEGR